MRYKCTHGHDRCNQMYAGPECQYCEIRPVPLFETPDKDISLLREALEKIRECSRSWAGTAWVYNRAGQIADAALSATAGKP